MRIKNISWSLVGLGVPLLVAAFSIPSLLSVLGAERFGLLALSWGLLGFASVFDLGIGRATTQAISESLGAGNHERIAPIVQKATQLTVAIGLAGTLLLCAAVAAGIHLHLRFAEELNSEVTSAAYVLAFAVPAQASSAMFRGINEAFGSFREISLVRMALGASNFIAPLAATAVTLHLGVLVGALLCTRIAGAYFYWRLSHGCLAARRLGVSGTKADRSWATHRLLRFGGWFTVSSVASPIMVQADRFFLGAMVSAASVTAYAIPFEVVTQMLIVVGAISTVAFPSFTHTLQANRPEAVLLFKKWLARVAVLMAFATAACAWSLPYLLPLWIGNALPPQSVEIGQILCVGVFMNSIGAMIFAMIHAHGRADMTAAFHLLELPIFVFGLIFAIQHLGPTGAALAWTGRMTLDTCLLGMGYKHISRSAR